MFDIVIECTPNLPAGRQAMELVERKGVGHPDSICDLIMESVSVALSRVYVREAGHVMHHNIDKGLLVAGQTVPSLGGGSVRAPMRIIFGDRAVSEWNGHKIPVGEIAEAAAKRWLREHLRFVDGTKHVVYQNEIQPGSTELRDIFARSSIAANDTSAAVGYAPMSETEKLVLAAEGYLNGPDLKKRFPETGEDVKVMGVRHGRALQLTVAIAMVDRFIVDERSYFERKAAIRDDLTRYLEGLLDELDCVSVDINTLDLPGRGMGGMYLTVLGTSAECGDGGQVGRGNRVNGLISLNRPMGTEAAAGKNPVSHVGKIYNLLSHEIARRIHTSVPVVDEVYVWLCSQIGHPVGEPWIASVQVALKPGAILRDVDSVIRKTVADELAAIGPFCDRLVRGDLAVC